MASPIPCVESGECRESREPQPERRGVGFEGWSRPWVSLWPSASSGGQLPWSTPSPLDPCPGLGTELGLHRLSTDSSALE